MAAKTTLLLLTLTTIFTPTTADQSSLNTQLFEAAASQDTSAARTALKAGADINVRGENHGLQTPLMKSVLMGWEEMVKFFLEEGADV